MKKKLLLIGARAFLLPACNKPADKAQPPVRDEDNPIMKLPEAYAKEKKVEFHEIDKEYRQQIIEAFKV